jgi:hypothetical protein
MSDKFPIGRCSMYGVKSPLSDDTDTDTVVKKQSRSAKPPEQRTGRRPIVRMILRWNETERLCRVLLD